MKTALLAAVLSLGILNALGRDASAQNAPATSSDPLTTIPSLDVPRYMGTWYEIAKYPNRFQKQCVADTRAQYSPMEDGRVKVVNRCRVENGQVDEASGVARQVGPGSSPKLEVRFAPAWLSFLPFVWGNYWVIDLDEQYQLAAVSEPKREYLWILSRTPKVDPAIYNALMARLQQKGFDPGKLQVSKQE